jgi:hypothetical protein
MHLTQATLHQQSQFAPHCDKFVTVLQLSPSFCVALSRSPETEQRTTLRLHHPGESTSV